MGTQICVVRLHRGAAAAPPAGGVSSHEAIVTFATALALRYLALLQGQVRIPANVTADSGNVTGIAVNVTEGRYCAF